MQKTTDTNTDFEVRSLDTMCVNQSEITQKWYQHIKYQLMISAFTNTIPKTKPTSRYLIC